MRQLPPGAALTVAALGGVASAGQSLVNADIGARLGNPALGAVVNNAVAVALMLGVLAVLPSLRAGLRALPRSGLPWWCYLGGLGGGIFVVAGTYAVPALGVALFTIAQVAANGVGGLAVDRAGLGPVGRLPLTGPRIAGTVLGVAAVALAQVGTSIGELAWGALTLTAAAGFAVAFQAAFNGRVAAATTNATSVAVNMVVSTPLVYGIALAAGAFTDLSGADWPGDLPLYLGGPLGLSVIAALVVGVRAAGVLRTGLAIVAGQLAGAVLLDLLVPGARAVGWALVAGALLTGVAVAVSGRGARRTDAPA